MTCCMRQMEIDNAHLRASVERERHGHLQHLGRLRNLMNRSGQNMRAPVMQRPFFMPSAPLLCTHSSKGRGEENDLVRNDTDERKALCLVGALPERPGLWEPLSTDLGNGSVAISRARMEELNQGGDAKDAQERSHGGTSKARNAKAVPHSHRACFSSTPQSVSKADKPLARTDSMDEPLARTDSVDEPLARTISMQSKRSWADIADDDSTDEHHWSA